MKKVLTILGTRPELIKLYPVIKLLKLKFHTEVCYTRQHDTLIEPMLKDYSLKVDYTLEATGQDDDLVTKAATMLLQLGRVIPIAKPNLILVQGDTLSSFVGALAAFYTKIDLVHLEAGLRSNCLQAPWPEEFHRVTIAKIAKHHFAPTILAKNALLKEGVLGDKIYVSGNTSIDAARMAIPGVDFLGNSNYVVITMHRRESFGSEQQILCNSLRILAAKHPQIQFKFYLHHNPNARSVIINSLNSISNIELLEPIIHKDFIKVLAGARFVITDSGGIQEEIAYIGKPALVICRRTERREGLTAGGAVFIGFDQRKLIAISNKLIADEAFLRKKSIKHTAFGNGFAAERFVEALANHYAS